MVMAIDYAAVGADCAVAAVGADCAVAAGGADCAVAAVGAGGGGGGCAHSGFDEACWMDVPLKLESLAEETLRAGSGHRYTGRG